MPASFKRALHHLELVGAVAELAQLGLDLGVERPDALLPLLGQPEALQRLEPADPKRPLRRDPAPART